MKILENCVVIEKTDDASVSFMKMVRNKQKAPIFFWYEQENHSVAIDSIIMSKTNHTNKIPARKCKVMELQYQKASDFLDKYHLLGHDTSEIRLGLYYNDELVSVMTFTNRALTKSVVRMELARFATKNDMTVVGGASKLLRYFEMVYRPVELISYSDIRFSDGKLYEKLGFDFLHMSKPNYHYVSKDGVVSSRLAYQKHKLHKLLEHFDPAKSEWENMKSNGFKRIFDCGNKVYVKRYNQMPVWTVYRHLFPNGKNYIGITSISPAARWRCGFGYHGQPVYNAIRKYGWYNIEHNIITTCESAEEAEHLESVYVREYKSNETDFGYNHTDGGRDVGVYCKVGLQEYLSIDENRKEFARKRGIGLKNSEKAKESRRIVGLRMKSDEIWQAKHAEFLEKLHTDQKYIDNHKEAMKKLWQDPEYRKKIKEGLRKGMENGTKKRTPVVCVTTGKSYFCIADAIADMPESKLSSGSIVKCCRGELNHSGNLPDGTPLKWRFENQEAHEDKPFNFEYMDNKEWMERHGMRKFICVETGETYTSINNVVVSVLNMKSHNRSKLKECLDGKRETFAGFHWKYVD